MASSFPWLLAACGGLSGTPASGLGGGAGVKSRSPLAGARSAGLEAGATTQAQCWCRPAAIDPACSAAPPDHPRSTSSPVLHAASRHINSYPVAARSGCTLNPQYSGQRAGQTEPFFSHGHVSAPSWMRSRTLDPRLRGGRLSARLIRPDRTSLSLSSHGAVFLRHLGRCPAHAAFSTAPSGTTPCFT